MKRNIFLLVAFFSFASCLFAQQNDTMYIMKNGSVVAKYNVNTEVDSIVFYRPDPEPSNTFVDERDGNIYRYVTIGDQVWMAENLRYLPFVTDSLEILDTPAYYVSGYGGTDVEDAKKHPNYKKYGVLYNWFAVMDGANSSDANPSGVQGVCPDGWHVPSDLEFLELTAALGVSFHQAGGKLKETGTEYWKAPNSGATNEFGFGARGGGLHTRVIGKFIDLKEIGYWWTTTQEELFFPNSSYVRFMWYDKPSMIKQNYDKLYGFSLRCLKD